MDGQNSNRRNGMIVNNTKQDFIEMKDILKKNVME